MGGGQRSSERAGEREKAEVLPAHTTQSTLYTHTVPTMHPHTQAGTGGPRLGEEKRNHLFYDGNVCVCGGGGITPLSYTDHIFSHWLAVRGKILLTTGLYLTQF